MINLKENEKNIVLEILAKFVPERKVGVFGSRAAENIKPFSDLDIVVFGEKPLTFLEIDDLREAFSESDLLMRVDIVDWAKTSEEFKKTIGSGIEMLN